MNINIKHHTHPDQLARSSFLWSEVRLIIAAVALFIGGIPPVLYFNPIPSMHGLLTTLLTLAWIVSGAAAGYMLYRWNANGRRLFGHKDQKDQAAFFVSVVSGLNLGLAGLMGRNLGMSLSSSRPVFLIVAVIYVVAAVHLYRRWKASGEKLYF